MCDFVTLHLLYTETFAKDTNALFIDVFETGEYRLLDAVVGLFPTLLLILHCFSYSGRSSCPVGYQS